MSLDATTDPPTQDPTSGPQARGITLTILWHPDPSRIGATARIVFPNAGGAVDISRRVPLFDDGEPLADVRVSRSPLQLLPGEDGSVRLWPGRDGLAFTVSGRQGEGGQVVPSSELSAGVVLGLGRGALVLVEPLRAGPPLERHGLTGPSGALEQVRALIDTAAPAGGSVLILGESGTGKELVARALHALGSRSEKPFVAINLAVLGPATAASQLFGHSRGSFTGADRSTRGYFGQAEGGVLFLDEVGAASVEVQAHLLRVLEQGEVQPVGGAVRRVDVHVVAATDSDLSTAVSDGSFRGPLLHRLAEYVVALPPLRDRPGDIATQAVHFIREALQAQAADNQSGLPTEVGVGWLGRQVIVALLAHRWPGNSRELRSVARRLVAESANLPRCGLPRFLDWAPTKPSGEGEPHAPEPDLEEALQRHGWRLQPTAAALGIGRNTLKRRMAEAGLRRAVDLGVEEIRRALEDADGDVERAALSLRVAPRALRMRIPSLDNESTPADG